MFWSFSVGRFAGTTVRIHVTFLLLLVCIGVDRYFDGGLSAASRTLIFVVAVFACVVAHEFGPVLVARMFGITTPDITLYPFGGIARLNTMPQEPMEEFLIAIAGPAVNIIIIAGLLILVGATLTQIAVSAEQADLASRLATTNVTHRRRCSMDCMMAQARRRRSYHRPSSYCLQRCVHRLILE
jgi:stage IV sporulation protein FB